MDAGLRICVLLGLTLAPAAAPAEDPRYLNSSHVLITYEVAGGPAERIDLWVTTDGGRTWKPAEAARAGAHTLRFAAPADGTYGLRLVLANASGASAHPPQPGTLPGFSVVVDTVPPLLQVYGVAAEPVHLAGDETEPPALQLCATLVEEHLAEGALRVFWKDAGAWIDGGSARFTKDRINWAPPPGLPLSGAADLRIVATDLAGNRAWADVPAVPLSTLRPASSQAAPATSQPGGALIEAAHELTESPAIAGAAGEGARDGSTFARDRERFQRLRELAGRFIREGRYSLGAARLEEALAFAPQDADTLADLGSALFRAGRTDDAAARYSAALDALPDHPAALEGLALVAATQGRYPQARDHLRRLARVRPHTAALWLRTGDIEHRLGNTAEALAAWRRVLESPDAAADVRAEAQRRLALFGNGATPGATAPGATAPGQGAATQNAPRDRGRTQDSSEWPPPRPSSSSTATKSTRSPAP